jgi:hypothetical protein
MTTTLLAPTDSQVSEVRSERLDFDTWKQKGEALCQDFRTAKKNAVQALRIFDGMHWKIAEWIDRGDEDFGGKAYATAEQITGWSRRTLYNAVWAFRKIRDISLRSEISRLTWNHFKELARLPNKEDREQVLQQFSDGLPYSVRDLREAVDRKQKERERLNSTAEHKRDRSKDLTYMSVPLYAQECQTLKRLAKEQGKRFDTLLREIVVAYLNGRSAVGTKVVKASMQRRKLRSPRENSRVNIDRRGA